jgi:hypothetical protein
LFLRRSIIGSGLQRQKMQNKKGARTQHIGVGEDAFVRVDPRGCFAVEAGGSRNRH